MRYVFFGSGKTFSVPLSPPADANTITWTVRDNTGAPITAAAGSLKNDAGATSVTVAVSELTNTQASGSTTQSENRFLIVSWLSGGGNHLTLVPYTLINFMPITSTPAEVERILGTNAAELVSSEIDIITAAFYVQEDLTQPIFSAALTAGTNDTVRVNQMITLRAAIELGSSLGARLLQMQKSDTASFQRFSGFNVKDYVDGLWVLYAAIRDGLSTANPNPQQPIIMNPSYPQPDLFIKPMWPDFWLM